MWANVPIYWPVDSRVREKVLAGGATVLALVMGWEIADGSLGLVAVLSGICLLFLLSRSVRLSADVLLGSIALLGYLIGNRGFAQLHPPFLPLLPAELTLGVALACDLWRWGRTKALPWRRDALNTGILLWIAVSAARLPVDVRQGGIVALRDFAMIYYALFFFVAQDWSLQAPAARWLERSLAIGVAIGTPTFLAFLSWPDWFVSHLQIAGAPLIFIKSDVAGGFMAAGTLLFASYFARTRRWWQLLMAALCLVAAIASNSRAALVALAVGFAWLVAARAWRTLMPILALFVLGGFGLIGHAVLSDRPLTRTPLYRIYESVASIADVRSTRSYQAEELGDKSDNNQFRLVWWSAVAAETWSDGRWFGLGFGHDLASDFLRIYYADANEEFSARSPHNFLFSAFGRTGLIGLVALIAVIGAMGRKTWRAGARDRLEGTGSLALWLVGWAIFASACFGVVLEGPMGAVVFWITLGLANGASHEPIPSEAAVDADAQIPAPHLRRPIATGQLAAAP
jgi:O-antigen ligase